MQEREERKEAKVCMKSIKKLGKNVCKEGRNELGKRLRKKSSN